MATTAETSISSQGYRRRARYDDEEDEQKRAEREFMALVEETNDDEEEYVPLKKRRMKEMEERAMRLGKGLAVLKESEANEEEEEDAAAPVAQSKESLLVKSAQLRRDNPEESEVAKMVKEEMEILKNITEKKALMSAKELAKGITYTQRMETNWKPSSHVRALTPTQAQELRNKWHIIVEGDDVSAPCLTFQDMKFPDPILQVLTKKKIARPTPIQMQGMPCILQGRDLIGIAFTGSGKTMAFALPMIMCALQEEMRMPVVSNEGPVGLVVCPSRELARQTHEVVDQFVEAFNNSGRYNRMRTMLCMGGVDVRLQCEIIKQGLHMCVATPGRLKDLLHKKRMSLDLCKYLCLDEADRMVDLGFEDDIREVFGHFKSQRQTLLFSATMPMKIRKFAETALVDPVICNVGRAGAANLDVIQEVEYVKQEAKLVYLLECLQKTPPPVLVFCENKADVDDIHEYLLLKGVEAVAIHGGMDQEERENSIDTFKGGQKDVLVATDVASKGLDFPDIQHVINYDMPDEIENYVHRIGRTGRCGKTGIATTFINRNQSEIVLLDLKHLL
eukprot:CAMPEP_0118924548 /NCGR_PEP_ID=MMETSP1169-20130426/2636_1 /TAXON_ID=36882 /ORGANISM="Pyramimonas obovata, Strain CCMP722" /LENGTH=561 /DNA_ID=CAMNT_0006865675 /DNA_START=384 /DNA_END=2065 /DNA_ORIENTATION=+